MTTIINFILKSSADPRATSLTIKAALLAIITLLAGETATLLGLFCEAGFSCYVVDPTIWDQAHFIATQIAEGVYYLMLSVSVSGTVYGAVRKLYRTITGTNLAVK